MSAINKRLKKKKPRKQSTSDWIVCGGCKVANILYCIKSRQSHAASNFFWNCAVPFEQITTIEMCKTVGMWRPMYK